MPQGKLFKMASTLDDAVLRTAAQDEDARRFLLALHRQAKGWDKLPKGWTQESVTKFWSSLTGDVKHKVTKCIKEMDGKFDDPGAFCASLADMVTPGWRTKKTAFNKYNAPEVLAQLFKALSAAGLDDAVANLRQRKVPQIVDKAWRDRG